MNVLLVVKSLKLVLEVVQESVFDQFVPSPMRYANDPASATHLAFTNVWGRYANPSSMVDVAEVPLYAASVDVDMFSVAPRVGYAVLKVVPSANPMSPFTVSVFDGVVVPMPTLPVLVILNFSEAEPPAMVEMKKSASSLDPVLSVNCAPIFTQSPIPVALPENPIAAILLMVALLFPRARTTPFAKLPAVIDVPVWLVGICNKVPGSVVPMPTFPSL